MTGVQTCALPILSNTGSVALENISISDNTITTTASNSNLELNTAGSGVVTLNGDTSGAVVSCGIVPRYSDIDAYAMTAASIDEAVRNAVCVGVDLDKIAGLDNFCWPDPIESEKTPDGRFKLAQLVRSNRALDDVCRAYNLPCISGKDSMKNDAKKKVYLINV